MGTAEDSEDTPEATVDTSEGPEGTVGMEDDISMAADTVVPITVRKGHRSAQLQLECPVGYQVLVVSLASMWADQSAWDSLEEGLESVEDLESGLDNSKIILARRKWDYRLLSP